ncbi:exonuclease 1 [Phtheirospermum japonicum]|uniref:Exonuclease 1 n=1 Tax=Phtheirospermum japonicum TaxID=374723 RepID=A0A830CP34_9LAMI|nr:exonuclease 1 [Phtheirospermum japonicum]
MGINNLLKYMKPYVEPVHIKKYAGKRVRMWAFDAYSWLHKGDAIMKLEDFRSLLVQRRKANRDRAMEKLKNGDAYGASELFQILRSENTEFVVAPYEADAQLAYLSGLEAEQGGIAAVISEDSDLLAYGCPAVVFKMDRFGNGEEIVLEKVFNTVGRVPSFKNLDGQLFTAMCVLAGCDFLPSVPGVGIAKSYNYVAKYRNIDRVISVLKFEKGKQVPEDYSKAFKEAMMVFRHARVYDTVSKELKPLKPLPPQLLQCPNEELDFLGPDLSPSPAIAIAEGNLDPCTMEAFDHYLPSFAKYLNGLLRQEKTTESMQEGCLTIVSCHKTPRKRTRGDIPTYSCTNSLGKGKLKTIAQEVLHAREALVLQKLAFPFRNEAFIENEQVSNGFASKIPNNNPFKNIKQNDVQPNQTVAFDGLASEVTKARNLEILHVTPESQESVDSKLVNSTYKKSRRETEKLLKQSQCNPVESKKSSILNFFSRV